MPLPTTRAHWYVPIVYFVRSDGGTAAQCTGLANVAYDGSGTGEACAFANPADGISAAVCTDTIKLLAGDTFDTSGGFTLPDKGCTSANVITITSTATLPVSALPLTVPNTALMPRLRATSTNALFTTASGAGGYTLDGLELADNAGMANINVLLDFGSNFSNIHDMTVTRSYIHQKETGTNYERSIVRAMIFNGTNLDYTYNYEYMIGYPYGSTEPHNSEAVLIGGPASDINITYNNLNDWYAHVFLGGSDTAPQHTATLTSASTTSATYSDVTGVAIGQFHRFSLLGTATLSNAGGTCPGSIGTGNCPTLARLTGAAWVTGDGNNNGNWGDSMLITSVADPTKFGIVRLMTVDEGLQTSTTIVAQSSAAGLPNGAVNYVLYQTARVTGVAGSVVTYDPNGTVSGINYDTNALNKTPNSAAWNVGDEGRIVDVDVSHNLLNNPPAFAAHLQTIGRGCPKGTVEYKSCDRCTISYNSVTGYPAVLAFTAANQNGSAPWITVNNISILTNWIHPDTGYPDCSRSALLMSDDAYLNTITPTTSVLIDNNLVTDGVRSFLDYKQGVTWTITHNTSLTGQATVNGTNDFINAQAGVPTTVLQNNIADMVCYGLLQYPTNYTSRTISNNVFIDTNTSCLGGITVNTFGTASALSPIPTAYSGVGFTNIAGNNYLLTGASAYKAQGTSGSDPGILWNTPGAPWLQSQSVGSGKVGGNSVLKGRILIRYAPTLQWLGNNHRVWQLGVQ
jgi:hypothetical protein